MQKQVKDNTIDLNQLCLEIINLTVNCCELMQSLDKNPHIHMKSEDNPVTEVDFLIQKYIMTTLESKFPGICIIGEEDLTSKQFAQQLSNFRYNSACKQIQSLPEEIKFNSFYRNDELKVWVDPLDGTYNFINGRKHEVTILIGVSYKGKPICGVIGHPYNNKPSTISGAYEHSLYFGSTQIYNQFNCCFQYNILSKNWRKIVNEQNPQSFELQGEKKKIAIGYRKMNENFKKITEQLNLKEIRMGGAGYKILKVIKKEVDAVMYFDMKTSKWDSCAGEAIIRAMGGYAVKPNLEEIDYNNSACTDNKEGFFFTLSQAIFQRFKDMQTH